jgi:hypothetical protein
MHRISPVRILIHNHATAPARSATLTRTRFAAKFAPATVTVAVRPACARSEATDGRECVVRGTSSNAGPTARWTSSKQLLSIPQLISLLTRSPLCLPQLERSPDSPLPPSADLTAPLLFRVSLHRSLLRHDRCGPSGRFPGPLPDPPAGPPPPLVGSAACRRWPHRRCGQPAAAARSPLPRLRSIGGDGGRTHGGGRVGVASRRPGSCDTPKQGRASVEAAGPGTSAAELRGG